MLKIIARSFYFASDEYFSARRIAKTHLSTGIFRDFAFKKAANRVVCRMGDFKKPPVPDLVRHPIFVSI
jgi:hypothetical protein